MSKTFTTVINVETLDVIREIIKELHRTNKKLAKWNRKLTERLNRVKNLIVGNQRIYYLDTIATTLYTDAELARQDGEELIAVDLEKQALFIQRLQYDLRAQHTAINNLKPKRIGRVDYTAGKYDPDNWKEQRP